MSEQNDDVEEDEKDIFDYLTADTPEGDEFAQRLRESTGSIEVKDSENAGNSD